jgi:hypothetical protein
VLSRSMICAARVTQLAAPVNTAVNGCTLMLASACSNRSVDGYGHLPGDRIHQKWSVLFRCLSAVNVHRRRSTNVGCLYHGAMLQLIHHKKHGTENCTLPRGNRPAVAREHPGHLRHQSARSRSECVLALTAAHDTCQTNHGIKDAMKHRHPCVRVHCGRACDIQGACQPGLVGICSKVQNGRAGKDNTGSWCEGYVTATGCKFRDAILAVCSLEPRA